VLNDPVNWVDPEGLFIPAIAAGAAAIGGSDALGALLLAGAAILTPPTAIPNYEVPDWEPRNWMPNEDGKIDGDTDMTDPESWPSPPADSPCEVGDPSKTKPRNRGEKSLYDKDGGEWRPHKPDKHHPGHWDHKPGGNPNNQWKNIDLDGNIIPH